MHPHSKIKVRFQFAKISTPRIAPKIREYSIGAFGKSQGKCSNEFRYKYTPSKSLFKSSTTGKISSYDQGGFVKIFGSSQEELKREIEELKEK